MGRHKALLTVQIRSEIESDLKQIPDSKIILKLTALKAATVHRQSDVAKMYNISRSTLQRWAVLYRDFGKEGLKAKPKGHNPSKLTESEKEAVRQWILDSRDHSGNRVHWTLNRLKLEILNNFGTTVGKTPLWLALKAMGLSLKRPRPRHYKADLKEQDDFKKNSGND